MLSNLFRGKSSSEAAPAGASNSAERGTEGSIEIDQQTLDLESWGYTGFLALDYEGPRRAGEEVEIACALSFNGKPLNFSCKAKLVRVDEKTRKLVGAFVDIAPATRAKMAQVMGS